MGKKTKVGFLGKLKSLVGSWRGAIGNEMLTDYKRGLKSFFRMDQRETGEIYEEGVEKKVKKVDDLGGYFFRKIERFYRKKKENRRKRREQSRGSEKGMPT